MAQMIRAILLASATAASFFGLRASNSRSHAEARPVGPWPAGLTRGLAAPITAVAPSTSSRRRSSSPCRLILPGRDLPAVEASRGVTPIQAAKCRAERKALGSGTLSAKLTPPIGPDAGNGRQALARLILPMPSHQARLDRLQLGVQPLELIGQQGEHLARQGRHALVGREPPLQFGDLLRTLWRGDAELRRMAAHRVDQHGALLDQQVARPSIVSAACCSAVLIGTNRMVGRLIASQIASASIASFLPRLT